MSHTERVTDGGRDWRFLSFRIVALIEGVTTLALFLVAMPVKYLLDDPSWVQVTGPVHGYAFLAYVAGMPIALSGRGLVSRDHARVFLASLLPFGTFLNDPWLTRRVGRAG